MHNRHHIDILEKGVDYWNSWRLNNPSIVPNLEGVNLTRANIPNVDLRGSNLKNAVFTHANLANSNLSNSILYQIECYSTNLTNAIIKSSDLRGGKFHNTILKDADLNSSNLFRADFINTILEGTNFANSMCATTAFSNVNLSITKGLDKIEHQGPSNIDIQTLYHSIGKTTDKFFIDAGISEGFLQHVKTLIVSNPIKYYSCFISYNHSDSKFAKKLYANLQDSGVSCWLDEFNIKPGDKIYDAIDEGIHNWDKILLCCSNSSLNSWWVNDELSKALQKEQKQWKERKKESLAIIPIDLDGYLFEWNGATANQLRDRYALNFQKWDSDPLNFSSKFKILLNSLKLL